MGVRETGRKARGSKAGGGAAILAAPAKRRGRPPIVRELPKAETAIATALVDAVAEPKPVDQPKPKPARKVEAPVQQAAPAPVKAPAAPKAKPAPVAAAEGPAYEASVSVPPVVTISPEFQSELALAAPAEAQAHEPQAPVPVPAAAPAPVAEPAAAMTAAAEPEPAMPAPAPTVTIEQELPVQPVGGRPIEREGIFAMATNFETAKFGGERVQALFGDINERAKSAMEKSAKLAEDMTEFTKGNVEAIVASTRVAAKGAESLTQDMTETARKQFESATSTMKSFAAAKSPTELFQLQSEFARSYFDTLVAETSKMSETMVKLAGDVAQPISSRFALAAEKMKAPAL